MADSITYFSTISTDAIDAWIADEMYSLSERHMVLGQQAKKYTLPERNSKTMKIIRYKRMATPSAPLSEGVPPDSVALSVESVTVALEQWGIVALLTDVAQVTTKHPALTVAIDRVSRAMTEMIEREIAQVLLGGTQAVFGGTASDRIGLTGAVYLTTGNILSATSLLRSNGAPDFDGGLFVGCLSPQVEASIMGDTTFANAASYSQVVRLNVGEIGIWGGVRWIRSNYLPIYKGVAVPATQGAAISGYTNGTTGGGALSTGTKITVVSKDAQTGLERKISAPKTADASDNVLIDTPTSTNYVYDIYQTTTTGTAYKLVFSNVAASTQKSITAATYTAGTLQSPPAVPYTTQEVFVSWVFGKDAFGRVELSGMSLESFLTPAAASYSNPLAQGRKVGAKLMWKSFIIDNNFFVRLESNSAYSANLPA